MVSDILYYDVLEDQLYDSNSNPYLGSRSLSIFLNNHATLELHYVVPVEGTTDVTQWAPYTGFSGLSISSSFAVDNNMLHANKGTTVADVTPDSTSVEVTVSTGSYVNPTGIITFLLNDGSKQSVSYTSRTINAGSITFYIDNSLLETIPTGTTVRVPEALIMKAEGDDIDASRANEGIFTISLYALSHKLIELLDYGNTSAVTATCQHKIISEGEIIRTFEFPLRINNVLDYGNEAIIPNQEEYVVATKAWVESFKAQIIQEVLAAVNQ